MFLQRLRGRPDRDQFQVQWPAAPLQQHLAAHRGVCRLCRGSLLDEGKRLIQARRLDLDLHDHHNVARTRAGPGPLAAGTVQPVLVRGGEGRRHTAAVAEIRRTDEVRLGGEAADHLEVVRGVQSGTVRYSSMVESTEKRDGSIRPAQPGARVWNHQHLEVAAVGLQVGDDAESWAALAHDLWWAAPHYRHVTTLPWPLHLAQLIGEYIVPVRMIEEIEAAGGGEASE